MLRAKPVLSKSPLNLRNRFPVPNTSPINTITHAAKRQGRTPFDPDCTRDEQAGFASKNTLFSQAKKVILIFHIKL
ncbi:hypothetical protein [Aeromonas caviae]|uniref:hypothetical protein n=1 Tax=Aeromonas caviae TaxID=648 RepID=UPI002B4857DC|nr:hypothetical protein [Aeromonas caviae]